LRDALIPPVSAKGEAPAATALPDSFLSGFSCPATNAKAHALSDRGRKFYDSFMESAVWTAKKTPVLIRAAGKCERCPGTGAVLEVHHRNYDRFGGDELMSDLEALCPACHVIADGERRAEICAAIERLRAEWEENGFRCWALAKFGGDYDPYDAREDYDQWRAENYEAGYDPRYEGDGE
jgi:hypothetical protein